MIVALPGLFSYFLGVSIKVQDKISSRKRLNTDACFVHVYLEIWDKGILKFSKCSR